jgi:Na+/proline symporter
MERTEEQIKRRQRVLITLQIVRFVVAIVMLGLAIYLQDMLLGLLALGFLILGTATTWLRMRDNARNG